MNENNLSFKDTILNSPIDFEPNEYCSLPILIVDDMEFNRLVLKEVLSSHGFTNLEFACNGKEAIEKLELFLPSLVILDLVMPEMDGFELCQQFRAFPTLKNIPILIQTALSVPEQKAKAFAAGATDFITKPVDTKELIARTKVHLERHELYDGLKRQQKRMLGELNEAKKMQKVLMPSNDLIHKIETDFQCLARSHFATSSELGGDFWGVHLLSETELGIYIVDFSGHGVTAALNTFRLHTIMQERLATAKNPGEYLTVLNKVLIKLLSVGQFATMFYGVIDTEANTIRYATAACPMPLVFRKDGNEPVEFVSGKGFPLGVTEDAIYETKEITFGPNDLILLYSDALIETANESNHFFTEELVSQFILDNIGDSSNAAIDRMFENLIANFMKDYGVRLNDDLTVCLFSRK